MRCKIVNCKEKHVSDILRKAVQHYASQLFPKGGHKGLQVKIILKDDPTEDYINEPEQGSCCVSHYDATHYKPIAFEIELLKTDLRSLMINAAHEMVHVRQYATRNISSSLDSWKGKKLHRSLDYWDEPWEIEAFGRETGLFHRFMKDYDLEAYFIEHSRWAKRKPKHQY